MNSEKTRKQAQKLKRLASKRARQDGRKVTASNEDHFDHCENVSGGTAPVETREPLLPLVVSSSGYAQATVMSDEFSQAYVAKHFPEAISAKEEAKRVENERLARKGFQLMLEAVLYAATKGNDLDRKMVLRGIEEFPGECESLGIDFQDLALDILRDVVTQLPKDDVTRIIKVIQSMTIEEPDYHVAPQIIPTVFESEPEVKALKPWNPRNQIQDQALEHLETGRAIRMTWRLQAENG